MNRGAGGGAFGRAGARVAQRPVVAVNCWAAGGPHIIFGLED